MSDSVKNAPWIDWLEAYQQAWRRLPGSIDAITCPQCGARDLGLVFIGIPNLGSASAYFWCASQMVGIHVSSADVPDQVEIVAYGNDASVRAGVPNYVIVPPEFDEES